MQELDPELRAASAAKGADILERGVRDFKPWSASLLFNVGDAIANNVRDHLSEIYNASQEEQRRRQANAPSPENFPTPPVISTCSGARAGADASVPGRANYFVRHWRGELPLSVAYWVNGVLLTVLVRILIGIPSAFVGAANLKLIAAALILFYALSLLTSVWQVVGTWRSASEHAGRGGNPIWATAAKFAVVLGVLNLATLTINSIVPQTVEFWSIVVGDKGIPAYEIRVLPGGTEVEFRGGIRAGSAKELERILNAVPQTQVLRLNSVGGRILEAEKMARLVRERGLITYASEKCLSAAAFVFIFGKERIVADGAKLGFHTGAIPGMTREQEKEMHAQLMGGMRSARISEDFITRVLATPSTEMWYPTIAEMQQAGVITKEDAPLKTFAASFAKFLENDGTNILKFEATGHDDEDRLMNSLAEFFRRWNRLFTDMNAQLEQIGEPDVFSQKTLKSQEAIRSALARQAKRKDTIPEYLSQTRDEIARVTNDFRALKLTSPTAKGLLRGIEGAMPKNQHQAETVLNLRLAAETAKGDFLTFMLRAFSDYRFNGANISFTKTEDVNTYEKLTSAISDSDKALENFEAERLKLMDTTKKQLTKLSQ